MGIRHVIILILLLARSAVSFANTGEAMPAAGGMSVLDAVPGITGKPDADDIVIDLPANPRPVEASIYDYPYSMTRRVEHWGRLWGNTGILFAGGFTALGILELLPENATAWNKEDERPLFKRYADHFRAGPVWDGDKAIFNAILHPYAGAAYYMSARSQGFNVLGSMLYCIGISTFFWEYGIECFMEVPSIQDLIITPIGGTVLGEAFYILKRHIVRNDYCLLGSRVAGNIVAFIIDPVNEVIGLVRGNDARRGLYRKNSGGEVASAISPTPGGLALTLSVKF